MLKVLSITQRLYTTLSKKYDYSNRWKLNSIAEYFFQYFIKWDWGMILE